MILTWSDFKSILTRDLCNFTCEQTGSDYKLTLMLGAKEVSCNLIADDEKLDFEANYKSKANRQVTQATSAFSSSDGFRFRGIGFSGVALPAQKTNIDFVMTTEMFINGAEIYLQDNAFGDYIDFEVVHHQSGVLDTFGSHWFVVNGSKVTLDYPAKIPAGLTIRLNYTSTGQTSVYVMCNLFRHWKA